MNGDNDSKGINSLDVYIASGWKPENLDRRMKTLVIESCVIILPDSGYSFIFCSLSKASIDKEQENDEKDRMYKAGQDV